MKVVTVRRRQSNSKKIVIGSLLAAVVLAVSFLFVHHFVLHAGKVGSGSIITNGVVNDISQVSKDDEKELGTKENPFLVLEIVPCYSKAEIGYFMNYDCAPIAYKDILCPNNNWTNAGTMKAFTFATEVTPDEDIPDGWVHETNQQVKLFGYYEYVGKNKGWYHYDPSKNYEDRGLVSGKTVYRPKFDYVGKGKGEFIWVTLNNINAPNGGTNSHENQQRIKRDNKYSEKKDEAIDYRIGDREYTELETNDYYRRPNDNAEPKVVPYNDFVRDMIGIRSKEAIDNFNVVVKTVEPWELNENPEWIDKANFIMLKQKSYNDYQDQWWKNNDYQKYIRVRKDTHTNPNIIGYGYGDNYTNGSFNGDYPSGDGAVRQNLSQSGGKQNDITWDIALKLFNKVNSLGEYSDSGAPLIIENGIYNAYDTEPNQHSYNACKYESKRVKVCSIDYKTMTLHKVATGNKYYTPLDEYYAPYDGYNNNVYKFAVMDLLMNQKNFNTFFLKKRKVFDNVTMTETELDPIVKDGKMTLQNGDAQDYWCVDAFLPYYKPYADFIKDHNGLYDSNYRINDFSKSGWNDYDRDPDSDEPAEVNRKNSYGFNIFAGWFMRAFNESLLNGDTYSYQYDYTKQYGLDLEKVDYDQSSHTATKWFNDITNFLPENVDSKLLDKLVTYIQGDRNSLSEEEQKECKDYLDNLSGPAAEVYNKYVHHSYENYKNKEWLSLGDLIFYLLHHNNTDAGNGTNKLTLKVLEVEPCSSFKVDTTYLNTLLPGKYYLGDYKITHMTTAEFNTRRMNDISGKYYLGNYNIVIFGTEYQKFNYDDNYRTKFNDSSMNGQVYFHVGDVFNKNGMKVRMAGTDITRMRESGLDEYLTSSGARMVVIDQNIVHANDGYIDAATNLYDFIKNNRDKLANDGDERDFIQKYSDKVAAALKNGVDDLEQPDVDFSKKVDGGEMNILQIVKKESENDQANLQKQVNGFKKVIADGVEKGGPSISITTITTAQYLQNFVNVSSNSDLKYKEFTSSIDNGKKYRYPADFDNFDAFMVTDCLPELQKASGANDNGALSYLIYRAESRKDHNFTMYTGCYLDDVNNDSQDDKVLLGLKKVLNLNRYTGGCDNMPVYADGDKKVDYRVTDDSNKKCNHLEYNYKTINGSNMFNDQIFNPGNGEMNATKANDDTRWKSPFDVVKGNDNSVTMHLGANYETTSYQKYQLDLDNKNLLVLACFGPENAALRGGQYGKNDMYAISPIDGCNNYYAYICGNIAYNGLRLSNAPSPAENEYKLLYNMLASRGAFFDTLTLTVDKADKMNDGDSDTPNKADLTNLEDGDNLTEVPEDEIWHSYNLDVGVLNTKKDINYAEYAPGKNAFSSTAGRDIVFVDKKTYKIGAYDAPMVSTDNETRPCQEEKVAEPKDGTQRIYFTAHDAGGNGTAIWKFRAFLTDGDEHHYVKTLYRKTSDGNYVKLTADKDNYFAAGSGNYIKSNIQYFMQYDKFTDVAKNNPVLVFEACNTSVRGGAVVDLERQKLEKKDDVYVFPLD